MTIPTLEPIYNEVNTLAANLSEPSTALKTIALAGDNDHVIKSQELLDKLNDIMTETIKNFTKNQNVAAINKHLETTNSSLFAVNQFWYSVDQVLKSSLKVRLDSKAKILLKNMAEARRILEYLSRKLESIKLAIITREEIKNGLSKVYSAEEFLGLLNF